MAATKSRAGNKGATKRSSGGKGRGNQSGGGGGARRAPRGGSSQVTTDHDEIRRIVEEKGGRPACVRGTESGGSCLLRIDYPGGAGEDKLEAMDWEEFFQVFDENKLAMAYDTKQDVRFTKFVSRSGTQGRSGSGGSARGGSARGGASRGGGSKGGSRSGAARGGAKAERGSAKASRGQPGDKQRGRASGKAGTTARGGSSSRRAGARR